MKQSLILLLLLNSLTAWATIPDLIIGGYVKNGGGKRLVVSYSTSSQLIHTDTFLIGQNDSVRMILEGVDRPTYLSLDNGQNFTHLFVGPKFDLSFSFDMNDPSTTFHFSGKDALYTKILYDLRADSVMKNYYWSTNDRNMSVDELTQKMDRYRVVRDSLIQKRVDKTANGKLFREMESISSRYLNLKGLVNFIYYREKNLSERDRLVSIHVLPFLLKEPELSKYITIPMVKDFYAYDFQRYYWLDKKAAADSAFREQNGFYGTMYFLNKQQYKGVVRSAVLTRIIQILLLVSDGANFSEYPENVISIEALLDDLKTNVYSKADYRYLLDFRRASIRRDSIKIVKGLGKIWVKNLTDSFVSMNRMSDRVTYVSIWATWCKPCLENMKSYRSLQLKLDSIGVDLVLLNMDSDSNDWSKYLENSPTAGKHFYVGAEFLNSEFAKLFSVKQLPRYLIINREGDCVMKYAPKPDSDELLEVLKKVKD